MCKVEEARRYFYTRCLRKGWFAPHKNGSQSGISNIPEVCVANWVTGFQSNLNNSQES